MQGVEECRHRGQLPVRHALPVLLAAKPVISAQYDTNNSGNVLHF